MSGPRIHAIEIVADKQQYDVRLKIHTVWNT